MLTVILSAGKSTRFTKEGFPKQKSMLPMPDGRTMLEWQIDRLSPRRLFYVSRAEYRKSELAVLKKVRFRLRPREFKALFVERPTKGPLDGLWAVRKWLRTTEELLIAYNDELIDPEILEQFVAEARGRAVDASVVCFDNDNPRYTRIPNTDLACGCTYYFRNGMSFIRRMARSKRGENVGVPEAVYASPTWSAFKLEKKDYAEIGTASEYKLWMAQQGRPVEGWS